MANAVPDTKTDGFSVGRVFSRTFATIAARPGPTLAIGLLFGGLPAAGYFYVNDRLAQSLTTGELSIGRYFLWLVPFSVLGTVLGSILQGFLVGVTVGHDAGRRVGIEESIGFGNLPALALAGLLTGLGVIIGYAALLVPGIIVALMWSVVPSVLVDEHYGVLEAFGRSRALTENARARMFGVFLILGLVNGGINLLVKRLLVDYYGTEQFASLMQGHGIPVTFLVTEAIAGGLVMTLAAMVQTSIYIELRNWKEGVPTDALAEIFA